MNLWSLTALEPYYLKAIPIKGFTKSPIYVGRIFGTFIDLTSKILLQTFLKFLVPFYTSIFLGYG